MWATLFGLLLWEALFADVPDTLRTPFQTSPLDLSTPSFAQAQPLPAAHSHLLHAGAGGSWGTPSKSYLAWCCLNT